MNEATNVTTLPAERQPRSVLIDMAGRYGMEAAPFEATLRATVCKGNVSREEFAAFLLVAKEYGLNPMTKELYAFPAKGGGIQPIVSIDGWARIINDHPMFDGMDFEDVREGDDLIAITCRMYRKDRSRPIEATEYMAECRRGTDVWKTWPRRMLRHKAMIQCARYTFGFSGIVDPDEYERQMSVRSAQSESPNLSARLAAPSSAPAEGFNANGIVDADFQDSDADSPPSDTASDKPASDDTPPSRTDAGTTFAGDAPRSGETKGGGAVTSPVSPSFDVIRWADELMNGLPFMAPDEIKAWEGSRAEQARMALLTSTDAEKAQELQAAIKDAKEG